MLSLWFEDEAEPLEDRPPFGLRMLKYSGHLYILFIFVFGMISPKDKYYSDICKRRLECHNKCSGMYFPSLFCSKPEAPVTITLRNNTFDNFYVFPDPEYVQT